jgi:hypothetical protein
MGSAFVVVRDVDLSLAIESALLLAVHTLEYYTVDIAWAVVVEVAVDNLETEAVDYNEDVLSGEGIDMPEVVGKEGILVVEVA